MGRKSIALLVVLAALAIAVVVAAASRGGDKPKPYSPPAASKQFGDDADLMRRLERKKLTTREHK